MSHSQFHCTGRAYLDMHGLIFETSICYWQDQPGRGSEHGEPGVPGKRGREARDATRAPRRASRKAREAREPGARGEGGGGTALSRPGDPTAPVPRRGEDARSRARSRSTRVAAHRRHRAEGRGGRGRGRRSPLSLHPRTAHTAASPPAPPPPEGGRRGDSPGQGHTADGRRAPSASVHHTRPRGAGDAGRRGHGDRPAVGKTGDPTRARASAPERVGAAGGRSRELPLVQHATAAADRRRRNGQRIGTAAGPGSETHQGAAPGSGRRRAD